MANNYIDLPASGGGAAAGVNQINGADGNLTLVGMGVIDVNTFGTNITVSAQSGNTNTFAGFDGTGELAPFTGFVLSTLGGMNQFVSLQPDDGNYENINFFSANINPLQDSPDQTYSMQNINANIDSDFSFGASGEALTLNNLNINVEGTGNIGTLVLTKNNFQLGNGTDPIQINGISYNYGFGTINDAVTMNGSIQGYGFQPGFATGVVLTNNANVRAFYDSLTYPGEVQGYTSYAAGPILGGVLANHNYEGFIVNANVGTINSNAGFTGVGVFPNIDVVDTSGNFQGIVVSPNIDLNNNYVVGLNVNMNNVVNAPGVAATLVVQDITYTMNATGTSGNNITVEYVNTATAGNEVASLIGGQHIVVSIQSGVSTATQVKAALDANITIFGNLTTVISGTASNPQVTYAETNLAGGINSAVAKAAELYGDVSIQGDVNIDGALQFSGALSIGQLSSFASYDMSTAPPGVFSIDTLITAPQVPANAALTGTDLLAINTAMLLTIGDNASVTTSFLGYAALGLPAVVSMGAGSTIDKVSGATFAISLDTGATGGSIDEVALCQALAIPNGATSVTKLMGYKMDLPFGNPATSAFGFYEAPGVHNYFAGDLKIGGSDIITNSNVALEIESTTKAFRLSQMDTAARDAMTPLAAMMIFNTSTNTLNYYNGTAWVSV